MRICTGFGRKARGGNEKESQFGTCVAYARKNNSHFEGFTSDLCKGFARKL